MSPSTRRHRALVTDADRGSAVAIIRSLGRGGWEVTAAGSRPSMPGMRSRYATRRLVYPDPRADAAGAAASILRTVEDGEIDLVVPVTDDVILPLERVRDLFPEGTRLALPATDAVELLRDKASTLDLARRLEVPVPRTELARDLEEAHRAAESLGWPVVLKPQVSRVVVAGSVRSLTVAFANDPRELTHRAQAILPHAPLLIQEYLPGEGVGVELLLHEGRPLAGFQHRRLRDVPVTGGASAYRESVGLDPRLTAHATRLMQALSWTGLAMIEFRVGADGPRLMEVNGRVWGSLPLAVSAGMDFPTRLAAMLCEPPDFETPFDTRYEVGLRAHSLPLEVAWILSVLAGRRRYRYLPFPQRRQALSAIASLLDPRTRHDVLSLSDPLPGAMELIGLVGLILRGARRVRA